MIRYKAEETETETDTYRRIGLIAKVVDKQNQDHVMSFCDNFQDAEAVAKALNQTGAKA